MSNWHAGLCTRQPFASGDARHWHGGSSAGRPSAANSAADRRACAPVDPRQADELFELGLMYASGRSVPADLVAAHKWLNLAAMGGNKAAGLLRQEIAADMSPGEIAAAQKAARDWLGQLDVPR